MKAIILFFILSIPFFVSAQDNFLDGKFTTGGGVCSRYLMFPNDSICLSNSGCESSGTTTVNYYRKKNDSLFVFGFNKNIIDLIKVDSTQDSARMDRVVINVFNQNGVNISDKINFVASRNNGSRYSFNFDSTGKFLYLRSNPEEEKIVCSSYGKANSNKLELRYLKCNVFNIYLKIDNYYTKMNFSWNRIIFSDYVEKFLITSDGLIAIPPYLYMSFGEAGKMYKKY